GRGGREDRRRGPREDAPDQRCARGGDPWTHGSPSAANVRSIRRLTRARVSSAGASPDQRAAASTRTPAAAVESVSPARLSYAGSDDAMKSWTGRYGPSW